VDFSGCRDQSPDAFIVFLVLWYGLLQSGLDKTVRHSWDNSDGSGVGGHFQQAISGERSIKCRSTETAASFKDTSGWRPYPAFRGFSGMDRFRSSPLPERRNDFLAVLCG
jgi:hypothetical protein